MIVIDTSAIIAIMSDEPERRYFNEIIEKEDAYISNATLLETRLVLYARAGDSAVLALDSFILKGKISVMGISNDIADLAFNAYRDYGKGTGHKASLNYGDCFSYALAKYMDAPLLFKGDDFSYTDIKNYS